MDTSNQQAGQKAINALEVRNLNFFYGAFQGLKNINLTSRPQRMAANNFYQKIGFEKQETNVYRLEI